VPTNPGYVGSSQRVVYGGVVFSPYVVAFDPDEDSTLADGSAGNIIARDYMPTRVDGKAVLEYKEPAGTLAATLWAAVRPAHYGDLPSTLEWGEQGSASGQPKHSILAFVQNRHRTVPYDDVVVVSVTFQFTGGNPVTDGTY
jgi:hypothetical protein